MRPDDLPRVLRSGTAEFAALAEVPDPAVVRRRGDRRRARNAVLSGVLAFVLGAGGGGLAFASLDKPAHGAATAGQHPSGAAAVPRASVSAPPPRPGIVAVTTAGVVEELDQETGAVTATLTPAQDAIGDQISVSPDGKTIYVAVRHGCADDIEAVPASGGAEAAVASGVLPAVSPDGSRLAFVREGHSGGPRRVTYGCAGAPAPAVYVMDLASKATARYPVPGGLPVSHLSWAPGGAALLVSAGPAGGNSGWQLTTLNLSSGRYGAAVPASGGQYYREGVYLPSGDLFVNEACCAGAAVSATRLSVITSGGSLVRQVAIGFTDRDHTSLSAGAGGQWLLYLSGDTLFVAPEGGKAAQFTGGLIAAAWQ